MNDPQQNSSNPAGNSLWLGGIVLIIVGLIFLVQNITGFHLQNWWALFIAIPGVIALATAWRFYQQDGFASRRVLGAASGSLVPLIIAAIFLFNLDWGRLWPLFLIAGGAGMLVNRAEGGAGRG
jgi:cation transport ATPase